MIIPIIRRKFYIVFTFCPDTQADRTNTSHENSEYFQQKTMEDLSDKVTHKSKGLISSRPLRN